MSRIIAIEPNQNSYQDLNMNILICIISMKLDQGRYDGEVLFIKAKN
jgi:hypothetical protein